MALQFPPSPRPDLLSSPSMLPPVPALFQPGEMAEGEEWFFNMKVHKTPSPQSTPRKPKQLDPVKHKKTPRGHGKASRDPTKASRDTEQGSKIHFKRNRKLESIPSPSPRELREQIEIQTARSIGDSLIFHNIPQHCEDTPEDEVVKFCQDYLVGRRIQHVQFGQVHKMEQRFAKDAPIAARFSLILPPQTDEPEAGKYQPMPYIPPMLPKKKLPLLKTRSRRKQCNAD